MVQSAANGGVKMVILWGNPSATFTSVPYNWSLANVVSHADTLEWAKYFDQYQEYRIVGCKIRIIPGTYIGDQGDARVLKQCHVGSSNEVMTPAALTL